MGGETSKSAEVKKMDVKRNLLKSIIYRIITITLGIFTAYLVTGDIGLALSVGLVTEFVQFLFYFAFDTAWSYFDEKRLRKLFQEEFRDREVKLKMSLETIREISFEFSQIDTFVPKIYNSVKKFFSTIRINRDLRDFHEQLAKHEELFDARHQGRNLGEEGKFREEIVVEKRTENNT